MEQNTMQLEVVRKRDIVKNRLLQKCGIAVLRIRTNESGEEQRIYSALQQAIS